MYSSFCYCSCTINILSQFIYSHWKPLPETKPPYMTWLTLSFFILTLIMCVISETERICTHAWKCYLSSYRRQDKEGRIWYWGKTYKAWFGGHSQKTNNNNKAKSIGQRLRGHWWWLNNSTEYKPPRQWIHQNRLSSFDSRSVCREEPVCKQGVVCNLSTANKVCWLSNKAHENELIHGWLHTRDSSV